MVVMTLSSGFIANITTEVRSGEVLVPDGSTVLPEDEIYYRVNGPTCIYAEPDKESECRLTLSLGDSIYGYSTLADQWMRGRSVRTVQNENQSEAIGWIPMESLQMDPHGRVSIILPLFWTLIDSRDLLINLFEVGIAVLIWQLASHDRKRLAGIIGIPFAVITGIHILALLTEYHSGVFLHDIEFVNIFMFYGVLLIVTTVLINTGLDHLKELVNQDNEICEDSSAGIAFTLITILLILILVAGLLAIFGSLRKALLFIEGTGQIAESGLRLIAGGFFAIGIGICFRSAWRTGWRNGETLSQIFKRFWFYAFSSYLIILFTVGMPVTLAGYTSTVPFFIINLLWISVVLLWNWLGWAPFLRFLVIQVHQPAWLAASTSYSKALLRVVAILHGAFQGFMQFIGEFIPAPITKRVSLAPFLAAGICWLPPAVIFITKVFPYFYYSFPKVLLPIGIYLAGWLFTSIAGSWKGRIILSSLVMFICGGFYPLTVQVHILNGDLPPGLVGVLFGITVGIAIITHSGEGFSWAWFAAGYIFTSLLRLETGETAGVMVMLVTMAPGIALVGWTTKRLQTLNCPHPLVKIGFFTRLTAPEEIEQACRTIKSILTSKEVLQQLIIQKPFADPAPDYLAFTNHRIILYHRTRSGGAHFEDFPWEELKDARLSESRWRARLSFDTNTGNHYRMGALIKEEARACYRYAQEIEDRNRELKIAKT
jgi:hypothetical protein